jgi:hypothetical protein
MHSLPKELLTHIGDHIIRITDLRSFSQTTSYINTICQDLVTKLEDKYRTKYRRFSFSRCSDKLHKYTVEFVLDGYKELLPDKYYIPQNEYICSMLAFVGDFELLMKAFNQGCSITPYTLNCASYNGHLDILKWITDSTNVSNTVGILENATYCGNTKILDWIIEIAPDVNLYDVYSSGMKGGLIGVIEWYFKYRGNNITSDNFFSIASKYGHTHLLEWGIKKLGKPTNNFYNVAIRNGFVDVLQWALDHDYLHEIPHWERALHREQTNILQWALNHKYDIEDNFYMSAVKRGKNKILQWAHDRQKLYSGFMRDAVIYNRFDVLKWGRTNAYDFDLDFGLHIEDLLLYEYCPIDFLEQIYDLPKSQYDFVVNGNQIQIISFVDQTHYTGQKITYSNPDGNITINFNCEHNCWWYWFLYCKKLYMDKAKYIREKINRCSYHKQYFIKWNHMIKN